MYHQKRANVELQLVELNIRRKQRVAHKTWSFTNSGCLMPPTASPSSFISKGRFGSRCLITNDHEQKKKKAKL